MDETPNWTRRRFVKTSLVAGVVGATAAASAAGLVSVSQTNSPPPRFKYWGAKRLEGSKAPRGIPLVPIRSNAAGQLEGVPDHLEWYRYCGRSGAPGLASDFVSDNVLRYHASDQVVRDSHTEGITSWWEDRAGQPVKASDFTSELQGAPVLWRSEGVEESNPLLVILVKVPGSGYPMDVRDEFFPDGIMGVFGTCAHFCCAPTWRASRLGYGEGHWDDITCHCHGSWYSVREVASYDFPPTA